MADLALALNVKAPALLAGALVPAMVEAGGGVVVNVGSINGAVGSPVAALYGATKAALHSLYAADGDQAKVYPIGRDQQCHLLRWDDGMADGGSRPLESLSGTAVAVAVATGRDLLSWANQRRMR